ncbi:SURF1 family protein [Verminephrobacter eiseniae]|uniref:SURF1 family protein n=1 Tax=Verminephrobacter eiseniae TaxID=364317 RepID=UPI002238F3A6|nr:SURF1 family protein [Verminephrobacter eiseniae]
MTSAPASIDRHFWLLTLAALAGMLVTASLGRWQLSRAAEKQALQALIEARGQMPAIDARTLLTGTAGPAAAAQALVSRHGSDVVGCAQPSERSARRIAQPIPSVLASDATPRCAPMASADRQMIGDATLVHRAVVLQGRWRPEHTVYLDNRQMQGQVGFFVVTPLQLTGPDAGVLLVQRGWAPRNFQQHSRLPPVQTPGDTVVQVVGRVAPAPSRLYEFQGGDGASSRIRQNLDLAAFRAETGLALANLTVLQTGPASEGLRRDWPAIDTGVDKHYGYAFQWFGLCGLMAVLYVWFQIVRRFIRPRGQPAA